MSSTNTGSTIVRSSRAARALGTKREYTIQKQLEQDGWFVIRASISKGAADLVTLKAGEPARLVEIKSTTRSPWVAFSREARTRILAAAETAGAEAWLAWWPPHGQLQWIPSSEWPPLDKPLPEDVGTVC